MDLAPTGSGLLGAGALLLQLAGLEAFQLLTCCDDASRGNIHQTTTKQDLKWVLRENRNPKRKSYPDFPPLCSNHRHLASWPSLSNTDNNIQNVYSLFRVLYKPGHAMLSTAEFDMGLYKYLSTRGEGMGNGNWD
ncbi:hypothetical protein BO70DRAFT_222251 [Aspergillus heteromorphus CBS 117.55]|uniref:Uncharacterized protein n=1 Tax=Aspergillus heteromorphus CBS 117.55 TaxID=1448321 RepID=A0A317WLG6_9EURO|nr:uncharacterized protein BO70DRAFT_222251 [Aspergillus heteromorphus CBS 117.55]PWY86162.1 hypothetical protein BO70DRAFT_222251 [Aspergillus heteromorphus CBS 117.55]